MREVIIAALATGLTMLFAVSCMPEKLHLVPMEDGASIEYRTDV